MIPNVVHFCYFWPESNFPLYGYLAVASAHHVLKPKRINFFIADGAAEPTNEWWSRTKKLVSIRRTAPPSSIFGRSIKHVAHKADVFRLQILLQEGGIYLDLDTICRRPFDSLLNNVCVLGHQTASRDYGLCNAVILAAPGCLFIENWLQEFKSFRSEGKDGYWDEHAVRMPLRVANRLATSHTSAVTVLSKSAFFDPSWESDELTRLFESTDSFPDALCHHLWASHSWSRYLGRLDLDTVYATNTTYNLLARAILQQENAYTRTHGSRARSNAPPCLPQPATTSFIYNDHEYRLIGPSRDDFIVNEIAARKTFFEIDTLEFIKSRRLGGVYVDIGANIGNHAVFFLNETSCCEVVAFEGNPDIWPLLEQNMAFNGTRAKAVCQLHNCFVSSAKTLFFNRDRENNSGASFLSIVPVGRESQQIQARALDDVIPLTADVTLLKLDVERHELEVLESALQLLKRCRPELCVETFQLSPAKVSGFLAHLDYLPLVSLTHGNQYYVTFPRWFVQLIVVIARRLPSDVSTRVCWRLVRSYAVLSRRLRAHEALGAPPYVFE